MGLNLFYVLLALSVIVSLFKLVNTARRAAGLNVLRALQYE